tara:strand:+ start:413 stop:2428 length:2016 start_codon:yes stop_codon:yes gene_type:complete
MAKNIIAVIQARITSKRFPGKVLKKLFNDMTVIDLMYKRLSTSKKIKKIVFTIPKNKENNKLKEYIKSKKYSYYEGKEFDVLNRFYCTAKKFKAQNIVRLTADCPLIDGKTLDRHIDFFYDTKSDYITNQLNRTYPDGYDIEILNFNLLKELNKIAKLKEDREHVTTYLKRNRKKIRSLKFEKDLSNLRLTLDYKNDLFFLKKLIFNLRKINFSLFDIYNYCKKNPKMHKNVNYTKKNIGQNLWVEAKKIIPPGSMLLSKNPDIFLKDRSPAYFTKAKGCFIWDLDGKKYVDICYMGVGTNMLGYSNNRVDSKVKKVIDKGTCSTLNSREDLDLAKKIIDIHPWFDAVRFGRGGADTNSIAIRLARSFTKKNKIAICGYHGWHDWYLSANYKSKSLDNFLFRNVAIQGVPTDQKNQSFVFEFNNLNSFYKLMKNNKFCAVIMEVERNIKPNIKFLKMIRNYCTKNNIVLIFDECSSGFREVLGGIHKKYKVYPDLAMFSKSIGNGYPITVLAGKSRILNESYNTFISSTYWSERVGPTAALASINEMERIKSWKLITQKGKYIKNKIFNLSKKYKINLKLNDSISIINFKIFGKYDHVVYKNFISQEMLKKNFICNDTIYISVAHTKKIINKYLKELETIFKKISVYEKNEELFVKLEQDISNIEFFKRFN